MLGSIMSGERGKLIAWGLRLYNHSYVLTYVFCHSLLDTMPSADTSLTALTGEYCYISIGYTLGSQCIPYMLLYINSIYGNSYAVVFLF